MCRHVGIACLHLDILFSVFFHCFMYVCLCNDFNGHDVMMGFIRRLLWVSINYYYYDSGFEPSALSLRLN